MHTADGFRWEVLLLAGDPAKPEHGAKYHPDTQKVGNWLAAPDNCTFDNRGRLWITTDQGSSQRTTGILELASGRITLSGNREGTAPVTIDDFQRLSIDGKDVKLSAPGKGHVENLKLFAQALAGQTDGTGDTRATIASTAAALAAVQSLAQRTVVPVDSRVGSAPFVS